MTRDNDILPEQGPVLRESPVSSCFQALHTKHSAEIITPNPDSLRELFSPLFCRLNNPSRKNENLLQITTSVVVGPESNSRLLPIPAAPSLPHFGGNIPCYQAEQRWNSWGVLSPYSSPEHLLDRGPLSLRWRVEEAGTPFL